MNFYTKITNELNFMNIVSDLRIKKTRSPLEQFLWFRTSVYSNGNLHWVMSKFEGDSMARCFDLETEVFTTFYIPPHPAGCGKLLDLEGRLCFFDNSGDGEELVVIWFMNKYGDEKSWAKELVIKRQPQLSACSTIFPLKIFKDSSDILFVDHQFGRKLYLYSNKTKVLHEYADAAEQTTSRRIDNIIAYTPNFLSLKTMGIQDSHVQPF